MKPRYRWSRTHRCWVLQGRSMWPPILLSTLPKVRDMAYWHKRGLYSA